jgi:catechol 2,3-dioxygenase-like lactoylglutathione lyase family enzyme
MLRLGIPVIGVTDIERAVTFWTAALDLAGAAETSSPRWRTLWHRDGSGRALGLMLSESPVEPRPRVHLDLFVDTAGEQQSEVARLLDLGATTPDRDLYPPDPEFVVLADPDGNLFCVVDLGAAPSGSGIS